MKKNGFGTVRNVFWNAGKRQQMILALSLFVMLGTLAFLTLPASTLERIPTCGLEEHTHDRACYLSCGLEETPIVTDGVPDLACSFAAHIHTPGCYEGDTLVCGYSDVVFHTHTDLCYAETEQGKTLICALQEVPVHVHSEECYQDELVCGQEEGHVHTDACFEDRIICGMEDVPGHVHTTECVQRVQVCTLEENHVHIEKCHARVLTCGFEEELDHVHTASCFDAQGHAICGKTQYLRHEHNENCFTNTVSGHVHTDACYSNVPQCGHIAHVHTDACYQEAPGAEDRERYFTEDQSATEDEAQTESLNSEEATIDEATASEAVVETTASEVATSAEATMAEADTRAPRVLEYQDSQFAVKVILNEENDLPEDAVLSVHPLSEGEEYDAYAESIRTGIEDVLGIQLLDIAILSGEEKVEPAAPVQVQIECFAALDGKMQVVHFAEKEEETPVSVQSVSISEQKSLKLISRSASVEPEEIDLPEFEQMSASVTGNTITFSTSGFSVYGIVYTVDFHWEVDCQEFEFSIPGGGFISFRDLVAILGIAVDDESTEKDEVQELVDGVKSLAFSNPELVSVSKVEENTTVGALKDALGLVCEYSAELTEEDIETINAQEVKAGDWALIVLKPFDTEETLTVTMTNDDVWTIRVTDAQITTDYITASGETYTITVTFDDDAGIPEDAELEVREIVDRDELWNYLGDSADALSVGKDAITFARFFDIRILDANGDKIEPQTPVQVTISYKDALQLGEEDTLSVVHFAAEGVEVIQDVTLSNDSKEITYRQSSFSVTATIATDDPMQAASVVVVIKEGDQYYTLKNDGTLDPLAAGAYNSETNTLSVGYPLTWTYVSSQGDNHPDWSPYLLRIPTEASGYQGNNLPSGYYYRYVDPNSAAGIRDENASSGSLNRENDGCRLYYSNETHRLVGMPRWNNNVENSINDNYIGVEFDASGKGRIVGRQSEENAAEIYFARITSVPPASSGSHDDHTVNHIDIAMHGTASVKVPLAYGDYFDVNGNVVFTATASDNIVTMDQNVEITVEDMKTSTIIATAVNQETGTREVINDAFYISGYSQNRENGTSDNQVRLEGSFKVANIPHANNADNIREIRQQRLANRIYYTVEVTKTVTFPVVVNGVQLYYDTGEPMVFSLDVTMSASFDYWDRRNECPAVYVGTDPANAPLQDWLDGKITGSGETMSGMDFVLGTPPNSPNARVPALEITKYIQDENGNTLSVENQSVEIEVYQNSETTPRHTKKITVGSSGVGMIYDYDVVGGTYEHPATARIVETQDSVPDVLVDTSGKHWVYVRSQVVTEYVWRDWNSPARHDPKTYTKGTQAFESDEEIIGEYRWAHYPQTYEYNGETHDGNEYNRFLEFYLYNIYVPTGSLKFTKNVLVDDHAPQTDAEKALVDGNYIFTVQSAEEVSPATLKYVQITVTQGVAASYKIADTQEGLAEAASMNGEWAMLSDLPQGDYTVTEIDKKGLLLQTIARGDNSTEAVDLENSCVTLHVTDGDTNAANTNAQGTFTNVALTDDSPDSITLDIVKKFVGLSAPAVIPEDFRITIGYTVGTEQRTIELKPTQNETNADHVKIVSTKTDYTVRWHITKVDHDATGFQILESNYDTVPDFDWFKATLNGTDITNTVNSQHSMNVTAPTATMTNVTNDRRTSDSGHNTLFKLLDGDILLSKLTANNGTLAISKRSLNTVEREAVLAAWPQQGGFPKPPIYFSIEEHPTGFQYDNKIVTFGTDSNGVTTVKFTQNASAQEAVFAVSYSSTEEVNNSAFTNEYRERPITIDILKIEKNNLSKPLAGAQFTLKQLDETSTTFSYLKDTNGNVITNVSDLTGNDGKTSISGLTSGYYEITETKIPDGYVNTEDVTIYIKVEPGKVTYLQKEDGVAPTGWGEKGNTQSISFAAAIPAQADDPSTPNVDESRPATNATFTVGNTPGVALPSTGGPGTNLLYLLGSMLIMFAGAGFILLGRKKRIE